MGSTLMGWARDPRAPDGRAVIEVLLDGAPVAVAFADQTREDLLALGIGDGNHGFSIDTRAFAAAEAVLGLFTVRISAGGPVLPGEVALNPAVPAKSRPTLKAMGYLERFNNGLVNGWAFDPDAKDGVALVDFQGDAGWIASAPADRSRKDLHRVGLDSDHHGFTFPIELFSPSDFKIAGLRGYLHGDDKPFDRKHSNDRCIAGSIRSTRRCRSSENPRPRCPTSTISRSKGSSPRRAPASKPRSPRAPRRRFRPRCSRSPKTGCCGCG
ncbi:MAG: hypothetical protein WDN44_05185 [Sphingomonas sp.]